MAAEERHDAHAEQVLHRGEHVHRQPEADVQTENGCRQTGAAGSQSGISIMSLMAQNIVLLQYFIDSDVCVLKKTA